MKITGIDIKEYQQFKDLKFDFTYPKGHPKEGQPMDKVCFIGQSGTGKTTLLRIIFGYFRLLEQNTYSNNGSVDFSKEEDILFLGKEGVIFNENITINALNYDNQTISISNLGIEKVSSDFNELHIEKVDDKFCLFATDEAINASYLYANQLFESEKSNIIISTQQVEERNANINRQWKRIDKYKTILLRGVREFEDRFIWSYIIKDLVDYDASLKSIAVQLVNQANASSIKKLLENIENWKNNTPNPRKDIADECLNKILNKFFLEVDIDNDEAPIVIKKINSEQKIGYWGLSSATKQILTTAIPIYKLGKRTVILFDEPERSLFPDLQREIIDYYTGLAPEAQFFFATHSPIIAAAFEPCERFILYFDEEGNVKYRNGVAPIGDDPNDILSEDFEMMPLTNKKGVEAYQKWLDLANQIRNEKDEAKKEQLISERIKLGNLYNF